MSVRRFPHFVRCGMGVAAGAALLLVPSAIAQAQEYFEPPAPGNLITNWGFDTDTAGWGSFGGVLARTENGVLCSTSNPGAATVTRQAGSVYTISDSQGGNHPTVPSTVAGESFVAYANVSAASASAAGKPARIILRERVGTTGTIIKESFTAFTLPALDERTVVAVSTTAVRSGSTLGLRIEQSDAEPGDSLSVDDVSLRRATRAFGAEAPGTIWTPMSGDVARISAYSALDDAGFPDSYSRFLDRLRVYLDGRGGATGSQKLRAVVYYGLNMHVTPVWLVATSREVTIKSGSAARWVDFTFDAPVRLGGIDGATYQFGLVSGSTRNVARYASTPQPGALWWAPDRYADGANGHFGTTDPDGDGAAWSTDDKQMSIQGIAAPIGLAHPASCF
jgi:hypothetical protein